MSIIRPRGSHPRYAFPWIDMDPLKLKALLRSEAGRTSYGLGSKISPLSLQATDGEWPGRVDCSGEFRWLLFHALGQPSGFEVPDGSTNQHAWMVLGHLKMSTYADALREDGFVRAGVLSPSDTEEGIGHIWMVYNGRTIESFGGHGPGSRVLQETPILAGGHYFVLTPPSGSAA